MGRLGELLELTADMKERESAAYSLATLKKLEITLERNGNPRSSAQAAPNPATCHSS
jgi:hypothetical protein